MNKLGATARTHVVVVAAQRGWVGIDEPKVGEGAMRQASVGFGAWASGVTARWFRRGLWAAFFSPSSILEQLTFARWVLKIISYALAIM